MRFTSLALIPALFAGFCFVARADLQPASDPEIAIDAHGYSSPISLGSTCPVQSGGGGICDFFNDFSSTIIKLEFEVTVTTNLPTGFNQGSGTVSYPPPPATPTFTCDGDDVFTSCLLSLNPVSGTTKDLFIYFFGTDATHPGIPPLPADCLSHPDSPDCDTVGHFEVDLNNNDSPTGNVGGWNTVDAKTFDTKAIVTTKGLITTPEPSMMWLLAAGCLLIFAARRLRSLNLQR
jgi:hypothetical protein